MKKSEMTENKIPKVAVLLAAHNGMRWIERQVESILSQKGVHVTIFFSVDFSTDATEKWVHTLAKRRDDVVMLSYEHRLGGAGRNFYRLIRDVDFSGFDAVSFSDQDDIWLPNKLIAALDVIQDSGCGGYSSDFYTYSPDGSKKYVKKSYPQKKYDYLFESPGPGNTFVLAVDHAVKLQKFVRDSSSRINHIYFHDWLIYAYFRSRSIPWIIDSRAFILYRQHETNVMGANAGFYAAKKRLALVKSRWYRKQVNYICDAIGCGNNVGFFFMVRNWRELRRNPLHSLCLFFLVLTKIY